jgi:hypothetical protein
MASLSSIHLFLLFFASVMCIFDGPVASVSATHIAVVPSADKRQVVVYSNKVVLDASLPNPPGTAKAPPSTEAPAKPNAMILPCPLKEGAKVNMIDLSSYPNLFEDFDNCFPQERGMVDDMDELEVTNSEKSPLAVIDVGYGKMCDDLHV